MAKRMHPDTELEYIDDPAALAGLATRIATCQWMAIDTEFLRERTYRPELCLLQIAADDTLACVDPLAMDNIDAVLDVIYDPKITKVLHAASQDLEIFYWLRGAVPENLFDTQIAAPLLGFQEQIGYGNLVREILGKDLSKSHSRADWKRRPLPAKQLEYAADDVIYLSQMYPIMRDKLESLDRLSWLDQEWLDLTRPEIYEKPAEEMWRKLRQIEKLKGPRLAVAQQLAQWRELTARDKNMPRNWLLKDDVLLDISRQLPHNATDLSHIRGLSDSTRRQHGDSMIKLIASAREISPEQLVIPPKKTRLTVAQEAGLDVLSAVVKLHADSLNINPSILAPRKSLEDLIKGNRDTAVLQGWRTEMIGKPICSILDGQGQLCFIDGALRIDN